MQTSPESTAPATHPVERALALAEAATRWGKLPFIVVFAAIAFFLSGCVSFFLPAPEPKLHIDRLGDFIVTILFAPLIETLVFQLLCFLIARKLGCSRLLQLAAMTIPFAIAHHAGGLGAIVAIFFVGSVLATSFWVWHTRSLSTAFVVVAAVHALYNATAMTMNYFVAGQS